MSQRLRRNVVTGAATRESLPGGPPEPRKDFATLHADPTRLPSVDDPKKPRIHMRPQALGANMELGFAEIPQDIDFMPKKRGTATLLAPGVLQAIQKGL